MMRAQKSAWSTFLLLFFLYALYGCGGSGSDIPSEETTLPENSEKVTITQGVWGNVRFWEGNFMPRSVKGSSTSKEKITPVIRQIYVHQLTTINDVEPNTFSQFYSRINTEIVSVVTSDDTGFYQIQLPAGTYSFFVKENDGFYANLFSEDGRINSVVVEENTVTKKQIDITYRALF
ncbi:MAG: hypothetical protein MPW16_06110 [Candidatus Manganitrophus sp.]|nr:MAG: hypothetical protein MPW16_06110 [Candidatus Manganitrophus sp.]